MNTFQFMDWAFLGLYFLVVLGIAWWVVLQKQKTSADYFLASRHIGWYIIGGSIFAANIGSEHVVGLAGTAAKTGVAMSHYELHAWCVLLLGWVFVPFYMRSKVFTMPEFLEKRYSPAARWVLSVISLLAYVLTKVSVTVYAGAIVLQAVVGIDFWTAALLVVLVTGLYTVLGGLKAVVYTDAIHTVVLLLGSMALLFIGLFKIGGWSGLINTVGKDHLNLWLPLSHPDFPWLGMLLTPPIVGLWYWCTDQCIVQRTLAAKDEKEARRGTIFAAFLKLTPFFIFILPGVIAYGLVKTGKLELQVADMAFPTMVKALLPIGIRGLVVGGMLAALMSSLAAVFNSCSTLFTMDIYKKLRPKTDERQLIHVGRIATTVVVALGIAWIPLMKNFSTELYHYLQTIQGYLAPPIASVFLLGLFWPRINAKGALTALITGFVFGMSKMTADLLFKDSTIGWLSGISNMNFLYFAPILFLYCVAIMIIVSMFTAAPKKAQLNGLTYSTTVAEDKAASRATWNKTDVILSIIVVAVIAVVLIYFSPLGVAK
ncbi:sodium:solute symporter [bacterium]|nr:sodium:solute symporter [bacterium]